MKVELTEEDNNTLQEIVDSINLKIEEENKKMNLDCYVNFILFEDGETIINISSFDRESVNVNLDVKLSSVRNEIWKEIFTIFIRDLKLKLIYTE